MTGHNDHDPFGVLAAMAQLDRLGGPLTPAELDGLYPGTAEPTLCDGYEPETTIGCDLLTGHNTGHYDNRTGAWWI